MRNWLLIAATLLPLPALAMTAADVCDLRHEGQTCKFSGLSEHTITIAVPPSAHPEADAEQLCGKISGVVVYGRSGGERLVPPVWKLNITSNRGELLASCDVGRL